MTETTDPPATWETITPEIAVAMLDANESNRNLRARVVNAYSRDMEHDRWLVTGETIKIARGGALLDGQHRLSSIIDTGRPQRMLIVRDLDPETRNVIDTGATRTGGDALRLAGIGANNPEALAATARLWSLWQNGRLTTMSSGMRKDDRVTHSELLEIVTARPDLADAVTVATRDYERIGIPVGPQAMTRTVLADIDAKDAETFFDALAGYATEGQSDPRAVLLYTIRNLRALGQLRRPGTVDRLDVRGMERVARSPENHVALDHGHQGKTPPHPPTPVNGSVRPVGATNPPDVQSVRGVPVCPLQGILAPSKVRQMTNGP